MVRAFSLFAGCGGCSLGLQQAGIEVVLAADIDKDACETYAMNLDQGIMWPCVDLAMTAPDALCRRANIQPEEIDLIVGGPPCQGFSSAGARAWDDPRNILLRNFVQTVTTLRPTWFIMENVEGLLTANDGFYIIEAVLRFLEAGYWIRVKKVYMEQYGLPQKRKRVFLVGNLEECAFDFPVITHHMNPAQLWSREYPLRSILDAIGDLIYAEGEESARYTQPPQCEYQERLRRKDGQPILHHQVKRVNPLLQERIHALAPGDTMKNLPEELQHPSFTRRAFRRVMDGTPSEKRGGAPSGLKRLIPSQPSLTITSAAPTEFVHPTENRLLTLRECARIQSFPDWFEFRGSWNSIATQIGNAIPPLLMEQFATHICELATWKRVIHSKGHWLGIDATKSSGMSPVLIRMLQELGEKTIIYA